MSNYIKRGAYMVEETGVVVRFRSFAPADSCIKCGGAPVVEVTRRELDGGHRLYCGRCTPWGLVSRIAALIASGYFKPAEFRGSAYRLTTHRGAGRSQW
jgi:hypothetical protein